MPEKTEYKYYLYMEMGTALGIFAPLMFFAIKALNELFIPGWEMVPDSQGFTLLIWSQIAMYSLGLSLIIWAQKKQKNKFLQLTNLLLALLGLIFLFIEISTIKELINIQKPEIFLPGYVLSFLAFCWVINLLRDKLNNIYLWFAFVLISFISSIGIVEVWGSHFYNEEFSFIVDNNIFWSYAIKVYPWIMYCLTVIIWFYYNFILHHHEVNDTNRNIKIKHLLAILMALIAILILPIRLTVEIKQTQNMKKFMYQATFAPTSVEGNSLVINLPFPKHKKKEDIRNALLHTKVYDLQNNQIRKDVRLSIVNSRYGGMLRIRADVLGRGIVVKTKMFIKTSKNDSVTLYLQPRAEKNLTPLMYSGVNSTSPIYFELKGEKLSFQLNFSLYDSVLAGEQEILNQTMGGFIGDDQGDTKQEWQFKSVMDKF